MIIIFGGSGKLGFQIYKYLKSSNKNKQKIINVDMIKSKDINYDKQLIGNLTNVKFLQKVINYCKTEDNIKSIVWSVRYRNNIEKDLVEEIKDCLEVELMSLVKISNDLFPLFVKNGTSIILISSINADLICDQSYSYHISKNSQESFVKKLSVELGEKSNARANIIRAGLINDVNNDKLDALKKKMSLSVIASREIVDFYDIAKSICFLITDQSKGINGATLSVDAGESILDPYYSIQRFLK